MKPFDPKDPWDVKRHERFAASGYKCDACGSDRELQGHHPRYIEGRRYWQYSVDELMTLCNTCHKKWHADPANKGVP